MAAAVTKNPSITIPNIPHLKLSGSNWAIFSLRFQEAIKANCKWGHFNRSSKCPTSADPDKPTDEEKAMQVDWDQNEMVAKYLLTQRMLDSATVHLCTITLVTDRWTKVKNEYSVKSQYAEVDLLTAFLELCCSSMSEVRTFLGQMCMKHEELAAIGVEVTGKECQSAILKSILEEMSKSASGLLTSAQMFVPSAQVDPNILIDNISEEADRLTAQCKCDKLVKGQGQ
jgi:gag-polypeptide of LTR copia-type